ncbi:unnamed protein product [Ectocarpus sp. 4 AP-2014]
MYRTRESNEEGLLLAAQACRIKRSWRVVCYESIVVLLLLLLLQCLRNLARKMRVRTNARRFENGERGVKKAVCSACSPSGRTAAGALTTPSRCTHPATTWPTDWLGNSIFLPSCRATGRRRNVLGFYSGFGL